jgi:Virulence-associated protein E/Primase C terminal 2 (PriCT-2)/Bifunctional DNA primase/polymerase, N-terminal
MDLHDQAVLEALDPLRTAGFALHWLHPRTKRPIGDSWSEAPVLSAEELRRIHGRGNNLGVRTGEPSELASGGYLHTFDLDIRVAELADEAWEKFAELFPEVDVEDLPCVASGSGGESRHLYFSTDKPFFSKKLAVSEGKHRGADGKWHYDWEIELFGTLKQVALPPSIHPDTGQPYRWLRPFDFSMLAIGAGPHVSAEAIERLAVAMATTYDFETRDPLTFEPGQLERDLDDIPEDRIDDYHDWIALGQALHHQFGASDEGFNLWIEVSKLSPKFEQNDMRGLRRKWRGFGRNRRQPVTMATVRQWALDARKARLISQFDEEPDDDAFDGVAGPQHTDPVDVDSLLGDENAEDDDEAEEIDSIDAIGAAAAGVVSSVPEHAKAWMEQLQFTDKGGIAGTLHNVAVIIRNDPRLVGVPQINEFTQETVQRRTPGRHAARRRNAAKQMLQLEGRIWQVKDTLNGELWSDDRDFNIRAILEAPTTQGGYGFKVSDRDLKAAIVLAANDNAFHPVREYLNSVTWDGVSRAERLFIDYLGAADNAYHRVAARMMLVAAVCRVFEPGHKFDFAVILEGVQGKRKSTFVRILGRRWYAELDGDFHDAKQMIELMQGAWILEIPELSGFTRSDVRAIKAFMSRQSDRARLAYARRAGSFPRQCIFIGSTNDREYLKDDTGGRRFWPIACEVEEIDTDALERHVDQIWAEAFAIYREMRVKQPRGTLPLYLDGSALQQALGLQESRRVETEADAIAGQIGAWLDRPIATGSFEDDSDARGEPLYRTETCLIEIWCECLGNDRRSYNRQSQLSLAQAMRLVEGWALAGSKTFAAPYGKQKMYFRGGRAARAGLPRKDDALTAVPSMLRAA